MSLCELLWEDFLCTSTNDHLNFQQSPLVLLGITSCTSGEIKNRMIFIIFNALQGRPCTSQNNQLYFQNKLLVLPIFTACTSRNHSLHFLRAFFDDFSYFLYTTRQTVYFPELIRCTSLILIIELLNIATWTFSVFLLLFLLHFTKKCALPKLFFCTPRWHCLYLSQSMLALPMDFFYDFCYFICTKANCALHLRQKKMDDFYYF
jgi:hypothetical protein